MSPPATSYIRKRIMELILASTSPYRQALLEQARIPFKAHAPLVDEESLKDDRLAPQKLCEKLARAKAESLREKFAGTEVILIGSDQMVVCDGKIYGKPGHLEVATQQLMELSGRSHEVYTSFFAWAPEREHLHTDITRLTMRPLEEKAIRSYVALDQPIDTSGSYKLEKAGILLFERIETQDPTAVVGLPMIALISLIREWGGPLPL